MLRAFFRIRQMIGSREFCEHIAHGDHREFELLCNVYGLPDYNQTRDARNEFFDTDRSDSVKYSSWQVLSPDIVTNNDKTMTSDVCWKSTTEDEADESDISTDPIKQSYLRKANSCPNVFRNDSSEKRGEKVIMETEINIENTPVTMRILEEKSYEDSIQNDNSCLTSVYEHSGIIRVLTDSELDEINNGDYYTRSRTPRRVTFGGESIKLRTPDSDSVTQSDNDLKSRNTSIESNNVVDILHIDIPTDNTNELSPHRSKSAGMTRSDSLSPNSSSPLERAKSARHRRRSMSPVNHIISPILPHKQIEVLHNLQRSPLISPERHKRTSTEDKEMNVENKIISDSMTPQVLDETTQSKKSWEDIDLIDKDSIMNLKSGVSLIFFFGLIELFIVVAKK